jgi:hypothetical protein
MKCEKRLLGGALVSAVSQAVLALVFGGGLFVGAPKVAIL